MKTSCPKSKQAMTLIKFSRPQPNFNIISVGDMDFYFSYDHLIGYAAPGESLNVVMKNRWGEIREPHFNLIEKDKSYRLDSNIFWKKLQGELDKRSLAIQTMT